MENHDKKINEAVDIDARTGAFKRTLTRLEQNRAKREGKVDKYAGMYDDGSGRGVVMPKPVTFNQESKRFQVEIDGRIKGLREAMKRVEMYRKLREEKKKTLYGMKKEDVETNVEVGEELNESIDLTKGQILDATDRNGRGWTVKEEELSPAQKKYRKFFTAALKKFGADSPADLDDAGKKKLFNYVKKNYKESMGSEASPSAEKIINKK